MTLLLKVDIINRLLRVLAASLSAMSLQDVCRVAIRRILRRNIQIENPQLGRKRQKRAKRRPPMEKRRRINLVPMQSGLMVLGQFGGDSDSDFEIGRGGRGGTLSREGEASLRRCSTQQGDSLTRTRNGRT